MVPKQANQHSSINDYSKYVLISLLFIFMTAISFITAIIISYYFNPPMESDVSQEEPIDIIEPAIEPELVYISYDFQPIVDAWAESVSGSRSVLIYDLERNEIVGSYNPEESYNTASLYKLFVVYDGYLKLTSGEWNADTIAGSTGRTILECLDLAIRESNSPCAETLWGMIGRDSLADTIINTFGIANSDINSLISNPNDILKMMKIYYEHKDIVDESLIQRMKDSFLNQPTTTYNWRQGLPSGFKIANVYNKVGWDYNPNGKYWNIYHDAAIIEFPENNRHFIVVVMTNRVSFQKIAELGSQIENFYYNN